MATLFVLTTPVTVPTRSRNGVVAGNGSITTATPFTGGVVAPHTGVKSAAEFPFGGSFSCEIGYASVLKPFQIALNETRSTCRFPEVSMPTDERLTLDWCSSTPPCISSPLGQPPSQLKKSPLTPIVVICDETCRSMDDTVSRPVIVPFESNGVRL